MRVFVGGSASASGGPAVRICSAFARSPFAGGSWAPSKSAAHPRRPASGAVRPRGVRAELDAGCLRSRSWRRTLGSSGCGPDLEGAVRSARCAPPADASASVERPAPGNGGSTPRRSDPGCQAREATVTQPDAGANEAVGRASGARSGGEGKCGRLRGSGTRMKIRTARWEASGPPRALGGETDAVRDLL